VYSAGQHNSTNLLAPKPDLFRANGDQNRDPHKKTSFKFSKKFVEFMLSGPALYVVYTNLARAGPLRVLRLPSNLQVLLHAEGQFDCNGELT